MFDAFLGFPNPQFPGIFKAIRYNLYDRRGEIIRTYLASVRYEIYCKY